MRKHVTDPTYNSLSKCFAQGNQTCSLAMMKTVDKILPYVVQTKSVRITYEGPNTDIIIRE